MIFKGEAPKSEAPSIYPVCPIVNPALPLADVEHTKTCPAARLATLNK